MTPEDAAAGSVRSSVVAGIPVLPQCPPDIPGVLGIVLAQNRLDRLGGLLLSKQSSHLSSCTGSPTGGHVSSDAHIIFKLGPATKQIELYSEEAASVILFDL